MAPVITKNERTSDTEEGKNISPKRNNSSNESMYLEITEGRSRKRKRGSRWAADESDKVFIPGMPTILPATMTKDQEKAYLSKFILN